MMGGTMRSPLTAMVFAVEFTRDFNLFPALLVGFVAALSVTVLLMRRSILTEKLARRDTISHANTVLIRLNMRACAT